MWIKVNNDGAKFNIQNNNKKVNRKVKINKGKIVCNFNGEVRCSIIAGD